MFHQGRVVERQIISSSFKDHINDNAQIVDWWTQKASSCVIFLPAPTRFSSEPDAVEGTERAQSCDVLVHCFKAKFICSFDSLPQIKHDADTLPCMRDSVKI